MLRSCEEIFMPPTYDLGKFKRDLGKRASSLSHMNTVLTFRVKLLGGEIIGRRDISVTGHMNRPLIVLRQQPKIIRNAVHATCTNMLNGMVQSFKFHVNIKQTII